MLARPGSIVGPRNDPFVAEPTAARRAPSLEPRRSVLRGAAFLMATSAIGPAFLTQTALFTTQLGASLGFAILASVVVDLIAQLNVWRVIVASGRRAADLANDVVPGLGWVLAALVATGGLAFNVGNIAGCGLGLEAMLDLPVRTGAALSALVAIAIFVVREAGRAMDRFAQIMGVVMVGLALYVAVIAKPPLADAALRTVVPTHVSVLTIVTLIGGTVGGYITFAGAHRLLDAGVGGAGAERAVTRSSALAIGIASLMRILLFLGALGVVARGLILDPANPAASVFRFAAGQVGYRLFGVVMWAAAITSVVGSAYTSVSFLRSLSAACDRHWTQVVIAFIALSAGVFLLLGRPVKTLVAVGTLNALVLPVSLGVVLVAARGRRLMPAGYRHSVGLTVAGAVVALGVAAAGIYTVVTDLPRLWRA
jgi:Mn2+/Fe2+ NRAMP family transporter